jgi:hypothetical protein
VFGGVADFGGVEDKLLEVAELLCGALEALVNVNIIVSIGKRCTLHTGMEDPRGLVMCVMPSSGFVTVTAEANTTRLRSACVPSFLANFWYMHS